MTNYVRNFVAAVGRGAKSHSSKQLRLQPDRSLRKAKHVDQAS